MKKAFPKSFDHVGNMPGTYTIHLDPSVPPAQHARWKVPIEYKEQIEKALQQMEDLKIITLVTIPTEWVSSMTYPRKPDGTLCICLDPGDLNKAIIREHYKVPTLEEISHKLAGATVFSFSKLDTKDGFWSVHLYNTSSHLTTFNTHKGRYRFLRMPFSLKMAQDIFQMRLDQITERIPGIIAIHDDIYVFGKTQEQHDTSPTATENHISKKTSLQQQKMSDKQATDYIFGTIFSAKGMKPDPIKIQALQDLPTPQTQKQLQSSLGIVNYLQPFLPDIAAKTTFWREQVSKWDWTPSTDSAFQQPKQWICKTLLKTLAYYDRSQPLSIQTDASEYGLGTALLQNNRPIAFASKTLTDVDTRYANIE